MSDKQSRAKIAKMHTDLVARVRQQQSKGILKSANNALATDAGNTVSESASQLKNLSIRGHLPLRTQCHSIMKATRTKSSKACTQLKHPSRFHLAWRDPPY